MARNRTCKKCFVSVGTFAEWVAGSPYCVEHAEAKKAEILARREAKLFGGPVTLDELNDQARAEETVTWLPVEMPQWVIDSLEEAEDEDPTAGFLVERFWDGRR